METRDHVAERGAAVQRGIAAIEYQTLAHAPQVQPAKLQVEARSKPGNARWIADAAGASADLGNFGSHSHGHAVEVRLH